ncbi:MAG: ACP S-malonyltransferase [Acidimicrobiia bacterium]
MRYAVLFPGQGSQSVGMGSDVFAARPDLLGAKADELLGWSLADVCASGPEAELTRTEIAQPALYAIAYALWSEFSNATGESPTTGAGHSLGEYTALAASGAMTYEEGLRLVAARGRAMGDAAREAMSGMAALLGTDRAAAEDIASRRRAEGGRLWVANINAPGQIVLAGGTEDVAWLGAHARELGARRAIPLKVAGAFHSPYMETAATAFRPILDDVAFGETAFPVYANSTAAPIGDEVAATLAEQIVRPVRFADTLTAMAESGVEAFVHIGPGDVTAGMARRCVPDALVLSVSSLDDVAAVADALAVQ